MKVKESKFPLIISISGITDIYLSGVVYEYCVGYTAIDGLSLGYRTAFVDNAIHEINEGEKLKMRDTLRGKRASIITSADVLPMVRGTDRRIEMAIVLANKLKNKLDKFN